MLATARCVAKRSSLSLLKRFMCSPTSSVTSSISMPPDKPIIGTFEPIKKDIYERLFSVNGFEPLAVELFEVLDDKSIMVRLPFIQLLEYIEKTDFDRPANRYLLWGRQGAGKTFTLNHLAYWGYLNGFCLVHLSSPRDWLDEPAEIEVSESRPGRLDFPLNAALALRHFKNQNSLFLSKSELKVSQKYTWSLREITEQGEPLVNVIDHGISRMKHASDCYAVLLKELKIAANNNLCRLMVLANDVNIFYKKPLVKHADGRVASVEEMTLARAFMKMFKSDWKNGLFVGATYVDQSNWKNRLTPYYPKALLTDRGWEDFDPFIPIKVENYSDMEADSCLDYYTDKMLLQRPQSKTPEGREEIKAINARNPFEMYKFCSNL